MVNLLLPFLPAQMPRVEAIGVNGPVLAFSCGTLLLTGLLAGLLPALQASRADLATSMKDDSRGASASRDRARLRGLLVIAQVAAGDPAADRRQPPRAQLRPPRERQTPASIRIARSAC